MLFGLNSRFTIRVGRQATGICICGFIPTLRKKRVNSEVEVNIQKLKAVDVFDKGLPAEYLVGLYSIIEE